MINDVNLSNYTTSVTGNSKDDLNKSILGKDDFLKMLMAQMKHQDPMNPMASDEFSAQLAQFSSVEKLTNISDKMDQLNSTNMILSASINNTMASTVIGKSIKAYGNQVYYNGEDNSSLNFKLNNAASEVTIKLYDKNDNLIKTISQKNLKSGDNAIEWNGKDDNGSDLSKGIYTMKITATDSNNENITVTPYIMGKVSGVKYDQNGATLAIGDLSILFGDVIEIFE